MCTSSSGWRVVGVESSSSVAMLKIVVLAPTATAMEIVAAITSRGCRASDRSVYRRSCARFWTKATRRVSRHSSSIAADRAERAHGGGSRLRRAHAGGEVLGDLLVEVLPDFALQRSVHVVSAHQRPQAQPRAINPPAHGALLS